MPASNRLWLPHFSRMGNGSTSVRRAFRLTARVLGGSMAAQVHFSADYAEARAKFLASAGRRKARIASHLNPYAKGPEGEDLFIDVATLGSDEAQAGLLMISATHGVEGFAGSGAQIAFLEDELSARIPQGLKITLIHALNAYGSWLRLASPRQRRQRRPQPQLRRPHQAQENQPGLCRTSRGHLPARLDER